MKEQQDPKSLAKNKIRITVEYQGEISIWDYDQINIEEERHIGKDYPDESPRQYNLIIRASKTNY